MRRWVRNLFSETQAFGESTDLVRAFSQLVDQTIFVSFFSVLGEIDRVEERMSCHELIAKMPEEGLDETLETLEELYEFYLDRSVKRDHPPMQQTRTLKGRITETIVRSTIPVPSDEE